MKKFLLTLAAVLTAGMAAAQTTNLLENSSFEDWTDGAPDAWTSTTTASNATLTQSTDAHSGTYAVVVAGNASQNKRLGSKEYTLEAGTYVISAYVKGAGQVRPGYVPSTDGTVGTYVYGSYVATTADAWTQVTDTFTLDATTTLNIVLMNPKTSKYAETSDKTVDDFTLTKVVEDAGDGAATAASGDYSGTLAIGLYTEEGMETIAQIDDDGNPIYDANGNPVPATYGVTITQETASTVTFCLPNFGFSGIELGDIKLTGVPVTQDADGTVRFGENEAQNFNFLDGAILATAKINETKSYIKGDSVVVYVDVVWTNSDSEVEPDDTSDDVPIYVLFKGSDPTKVGITTTTTTARPADNRIYDLQGRQLNAIKNKGISIVGGRKVLR